MLVLLYLCIVGSLIFTGRTEDACYRWPNHKNFHLLHSEDDCGQVKVIDEDTISARVLNGQNAQRGSAPWMAYVLSKNDSESHWSMCGGSIINDRYILTAAHCHKENTPVKVLLGLYNASNMYDGVTEVYGMEKFITHPAYNRKLKKNDIALIRVDRKISFQSPFINYVCLPFTCDMASDTYVGKNATLTGWGRVFYDYLATVLQRVVLPVKPCKSNYVSGVKHPILCAGSGFAKACKGDSGAPLVIQSVAARTVQIGVMVFAPVTDCSVKIDENSLSKFSRVSFFIDWILETIEP